MNTQKSNNNNEINVKITISVDKGSEKIFKVIKTTINKSQTLNKWFNKFLLFINLNIGRTYYFYLKRNGEKERELDRNKTILELELKDNEEILVSDKKYQFLKMSKIQTTSVLHLESEVKETSKQPLGDIDKVKSKNEKILREKDVKIINIRKNIKSSEKNIDKNRKKIMLLLLLLLSSLIFIGFVIFLYFYVFKNRKKFGEKFFEQKEDLIINKNYP